MHRCRLFPLRVFSPPLRGPTLCSKWCDGSPSGASTLSRRPLLVSPHGLQVEVRKVIKFCCSSENTARFLEERDLEELAQRSNDLEARFFLFNIAKKAISGIASLAR